MTIAPKLQHYLDSHDADYALIEHAPTRSAMQNANICHVPPERVAKAVLLNTPSNYLLAVLPSDCRIELADLRSELDQKPQLAGEEEIASVFDDCAVGAVPSLGFGYGVGMIVDDSLAQQPDIYFEGGDHASLIHMNQSEFGRLTQGAQHGSFSERWVDRV